MSLGDFFDDKDLLGSNYEKFNQLKKKFQDEGMPENIASYKAMNYLTPEKLEKVDLIPQKDFKKDGITFFFDTKEDMKLVMKYFKTSMVSMQIGDSKLLIELLKLMEGTDE